MASGGDKGRPTRRGFGEPSRREGIDSPGHSGVELDEIHESGPPALLDGPWRAVEIWTHHRVYALDAYLQCTEVIDRATGKAQPDHKVLGSRLVGGQRRAESGAIVQVSHPLPEPGATAVFTLAMGKRLSYSETTPVTRVVYRQRVVEVEQGERAPTWDDVTGPGKPA